MVLKEVKNIADIERLNAEAFPVEEQIPIYDLVRMSKQDEYALLAAYEEEQFIGFTFLTVKKPSVYLFLLAVSLAFLAASLARCAASDFSKIAFASAGFSSR